MDAFTHGLASYSLTRAIFPRATGMTWIAAVLTGVAADVDQFSRNGNAATFLTWHRTYLHSIVVALGIAIVFSLIVLLASTRQQNKDSPHVVFTILIAVCLLHIATDWTQNEGVQLLWPLRQRRYSADWVAHFDFWILIILLAGVLLPQLLRLVTEEIGAKSKAPRGRVGAVIALLGVCAYIGGRAILHGNAVAAMAARTYRDEFPRRVAAFAESDSPLHWHGIVETERAIHSFELDLTLASSFNPDAGAVSYKPEPSPTLDAARSTGSARLFLQAARFPKASIEKTPTGFHIELRDLANQAGIHPGPYVVAVIETDANARVVSDELVWRRF